ncbi:translation elongation factor 4 [Candidatus Babeliales bacterium]|nr:translation elongation factor 4 [Candidatus Babeliales bacterium]MBP9843852.1 translation elongation factor 4 [Candidatus Babeliales bacterium]
MDIKKINLQDIASDHVRNFSIIAHIDHGKSTLADRLLEFTGTLSTRTGENKQFLDKLQVEKERGITVKAQTASMFYTYKNELYLLNLIDTPGHVDFTYEVSRSLYACQGALLLVDASQGVEAQTMANFYLAFDQNLKVLPVINKIDLPTANIEKVTGELNRLFDFDENDAILTSAKSGIGINDVLENIITRIPAPESDVTKPLKALLFDSRYDDYRGVICLIAVKDGVIKKGDTIVLMQTNTYYDVLEIGLMYPEETPMPALYAGQVGYIITGMKTVREAKIGDTIAHKSSPVEPFPGFAPSKPMMFAGIFPVVNTDFENLADAIAKLTLNDASVTIEKKSSAALGLGFRCGFLGLLHMDVFKQRLEQEYDLVIITTAPSVLYKIQLTHDRGLIEIENPSDFPDPAKIEHILEPMINATIIVPEKFLGNVFSLCQEKRGHQTNMSYLDENRVIVTYKLPLNEVATDFYDKLKSLTSGYASLDYEVSGYEIADLVKMDILLNGVAVDALSCIIHRSNAQTIGRELCAKLKEVIHRQLFEVVIQAAIGVKILARDQVSPLRKNVTAKCYGGDITRKRKLLEKQKEGKKRMKQVGNVEVPQEAFLAILRK